MKPGTTVFPASSSTVVFGPTKTETDSSLPTETNLPSVTAKAWAWGWLVSLVKTWARRTTRSAGVGEGAASLQATHQTNASGSNTGRGVYREGALTIRKYLMGSDILGSSFQRFFQDSLPRGIKIHVRGATLSPHAIARLKHARSPLHELTLLFWRQLHHAPMLVRITERREDSAL